MFSSVKLKHSSSDCTLPSKVVEEKHFYGSVYLHPKMHVYKGALRKWRRGTTGVTRFFPVKPPKSVCICAFRNCIE